MTRTEIIRLHRWVPDGDAKRALVTATDEPALYSAAMNLSRCTVVLRISVPATRLKGGSVDVRVLNGTSSARRRQMRDVMRHFEVLRVEFRHRNKIYRLTTKENNDEIELQLL